MDVRVLDLDGAVAAQCAVSGSGAEVVAVQDWGPRLRLACGFRSFDRFRQELTRRMGGPLDCAPRVTFCGSGDFHHISLALLHRLDRPFNLLVLDNHPDWMCGLPFLHCGTWLRHALDLPQVRHVFHAGGDVDFDNGYHWLAPRRHLRDRCVTVFPATRRFSRGPWRSIAHEPLRPKPGSPVTPARLQRLLDPWRDVLGRWPLYVSLDKDVMVPAEATVNWDSGHLRLAEVGHVLTAFRRAAGDIVLGMDVVGDWSPVKVSGSFRRLLHVTEHLPADVKAADAQQLNERTNLALLRLWQTSTALSA